jgi:hypothetical protein
MTRRTARFLTAPALVAAMLTLSCSDSGGNGTGPAPVTTVTVSPGSVTLTFVGETRQMSATAKDAAGNTVSVTFTWTSNNPAVAEVSSSGVVTARSAGVASITATGGGVTSAPSSVALDQQVGGVELDVSSLSFASLGESQTLTATAVDEGGTPVPDAAVSWVTTNDLVATVSSEGVVTAKGNGTADIRATANGRSATAFATVQQVAASAERTSPAAVDLASLGESSQIELEARDAMGRFIDAPTASYVSSDPTVASVAPSGRIGAVSNGTATISITVDGVPVDPVEVTVEQVAVDVVVDAQLVILSAVAATQELNAEAVDARGNPIEDASVTWDSDDPAIASVQPSGKRATVTAQAEGVTSVTAMNEALSSDPVEVFVGNGQVVQLESGDRIDDLLGPAGFQRFYKITVPAGAGELHVGTGGGTAFDGSGPGDLDLFMKFGAQPTNDFNDESQENSGNASNEEFIQVLDPQPGEWFILVDGFVDNTGSGPGYAGVTLSIDVKTEPKGFDIELLYISQFSDAEKQIIRAAADRWESILPADLFSIWLNIPATPNPVCGVPGLSTNTYVDDLVILVALFDEGPGGTLAQAGPCQIRRGSNQDLLPIIGFMAFDIQDIDGLSASGQLAETALHEMGHVMGVGSLWDPPPQFNQPSLLVGGGTANPFFTGPLAIQAFDDAGGTTFSGNKVPVENTGGDGTRDSHWREAVFDDELMTGFAEVNPGEKLSMVTIQSLLDMGWLEVNTDEADDYQLPGSSGVPPVSPEQARTGMPRVDDVFKGDLYGVDENGERTLLRSLFRIPLELVRRILP